MQKRNKVIAVIIAVLLFATLLFSYIFVIEHVRHDCTGDNCPICMEIEAALLTISSMKTLPLLPLFLAVFGVFTSICMVCLRSNHTKDTLITLKVELLD